MLHFEFENELKFYNLRAWVEPHNVGNPEDKFCRIEASITVNSSNTLTLCLLVSPILIVFANSLDPDQAR